jgi:NADPH:quinone reductase-like Zn-dependent oxidoreductase
LQCAHFSVFHAWEQAEVWARGVADLVPLVASEAVDPHITRVYPWEQAPDAHRSLEGRKTQGKLALRHS